MPYQALVGTSPVVVNDRIDRIETDLVSKETANLVGTRVYAAGVVPIVTTQGTDVTPTIGRVYICELRINKNTLLTGLSYLIGSVGGTDKAIAFLFDSSGAVLATSAVAGTTVGTTATMQRLAFIAAYQAAPGLYYVGVQMNGTTARIRCQAFGDHAAGSVDQTFGTPVAVTPPSTFTTATAPLAMTY